MAALDFKDRAAVLAFLVTAMPNANATAIETLLDASAGTTCEEPIVPVYRPFFVQASLQEQALNELKSARGASGASVEYRDNAKAVRSLLNQQSALDHGICSIPTGMEATGGGTVRMRTVF